MSDEQELYLLSLEEEVKALRSVLAEFESDKMEFTQMGKANALEQVRNHLRRPT